jgi:virginiamycin B lyase
VRGSLRVRRVLVLCLAAIGSASVVIALAALTSLSGTADATAAPALDHFECYSATGASTEVQPVGFRNTPAKVLLKNKFASGGFLAAPGTVQLQCNPVRETDVANGHSVTTPITNAAAHLLCRAIKPTGLSLPATVTMKNQYGSGVLVPTAAKSLCMPSWETETTPLKFPSAVAPPNLDAFACYTATHPSGTRGFSRPTSAHLTDQFGTLATSVGAPNLLCLPTSETAKPSGGAPAVVNPDHSLVCFALPPAKSVTPRTVYDKNQFGVGAVSVARNSELCLPSTKVVVPPTTTTSSTTTTTAPGVVTSYTGPGVAGPYDIATGPDNALWFTNYFGDSIGRITTDGSIANVPNANHVSRPDGIARGADGAMWFANTASSTIGRVTTDGTDTFSSYDDPRIAYPYRVAAGPGGVTWFTNSASNSVGWVTSSGVTNVFYNGSIQDPQGITAGPDGAMWFANFYGGSIGRVTAAGEVTSYGNSTVVAPLSITAGPDGALWFTNPGNSSIGRITTDGTITNFSGPQVSSPIDIVTGSDGALWFTNYGNNSIGRITTAGVLTSYFDPSISYPDGIAAGPDGAIWFTNAGTNTIGRISV